MINVDNVICGYEFEVVNWIKEHYKELGYDQILEEKSNQFPDFVFSRNGQKIRVEVEVYSSSFLKHGHDFKEVDEVLCLIKDKELPVKIIEIKALKLWYQLKGEELVDFFKQTPDCTLVDHRCGKNINHFQHEWLKLSPEDEVNIRKNLNLNAKLLEKMGR